MYCIARVYGVYSVHNPDQSDATFDANVRVCADNGVDAFICTDANIITIMVTVAAKHYELRITATLRPSWGEQYIGSDQNVHFIGESPIKGTFRFTPQSLTFPNHFLPMF